MSRRSRVLIRCDAGRDIGLGHRVRCQAIAEAMRDAGAEVRFLMGGDADPTPLVTAGFAVEGQPGTGGSDGWLDRAVALYRPQGLVVDVRDDTTRECLERQRGRGVRVAIIDDGSERRLAADFAFYPPVPQLESLDWTGFKGELLVGWQWLPLRRQFAQRPPEPADRISRILVSLGGSDPHGLTLRVLQALNPWPDSITPVVVVGTENRQRDRILGWLARELPQAEVRVGAADMAGVLRSVDLAVAAYGMTAAELVACGVPALLIGLSDDHLVSARALETAGVARCLGRFDRMNDATLHKTFRALVGDDARRRQMALACRGLIDGRGAERIAHRILGMKEREHACAHAG